MSNFGVRHLRLVEPYTLAFREARSAVNSTDILHAAKEFKTVAEAIADSTVVVGTTAVRHRDLKQPIHRLGLRSGGTVRKQLQTGRVALLFGSEKYGLSNEDLSHCHWLLHIPTEENHVSMNLAQAVAVCLYELSGAKSAPSGAKKSKTERDSKSATAGQTEQVTVALLEALHISGYVKPGTEAVCEKKLRRLMLRLNFEGMDAEVLLGMVRQIVWKLRQGDCEPFPQQNRVKK